MTLNNRFKCQSESTYLFFSLEIVSVLTLSANVEMCCDINVFPNQHMALILILQGNILAVV